MSNHYNCIVHWRRPCSDEDSWNHLGDGVCVRVRVFVSDWVTEWKRGGWSWRGSPVPGLVFSGIPLFLEAWNERNWIGVAWGSLLLKNSPHVAYVLLLPTVFFLKLVTHFSFELLSNKKWKCYTHTCTLWHTCKSVFSRTVNSFTQLSMVLQWKGWSQATISCSAGGFKETDT